MSASLLAAQLVPARADAAPAKAPDATEGSAVATRPPPRTRPPLVVSTTVSSGPVQLLEIVAQRRPPVHFTVGTFIGGMAKPRLATPAHWAVGYAPELSVFGGGELEHAWTFAMRHMFAMQGVVGRRGRIFWSLAGGIGLDFSPDFEALGPTMSSRVGMASRSHPDRRHRLVGGLAVSGIMQLSGDTTYPRSQIGAFVGWTWL